MIILDEDALICDLAETYRIYDMRSLPVRLVATLSAGLREDSRIIRKNEGRKISLSEMLLAHILDKVNILVWFQTEDGRKGDNRPKSVLADLLDIKEENENNVEGFDSPLDFERRRKELIGG